MVLQIVPLTIRLGLNLGVIARLSIVVVSIYVAQQTPIKGHQVWCVRKT